MGLQRQLSEEEWALLSIIKDPILLGEFCRNTNDGSPNKEEWSKQIFKYRWYQKDLLSDKSPFIVLTAGRAVGKCQGIEARIYTYPYGYIKIIDLFTIKKESMYELSNISAYTLDKDNVFTQRRIRLDSNGVKSTYKVTTEFGHIISGTDNHPILTPIGYKNIIDLDIENDKVAIATWLPHESKQNLFSWEELRWFGYIMGLHKVRPEIPLTVKYQRNIVELQHIAEYFSARFTRNANGTFSLLRKPGPLKHYGTYLLKEVGFSSGRWQGFYRMPFILKAERLENIKIFLESFLSTYAEISLEKITIQHRHKNFIFDLQELLLRFGIESKIINSGEFIPDKLDNEDYHWSILIDEYKDIYKLFTELDIPGISAKNLKPPALIEQPLPFMRWDYIKSIEEQKPRPTYSIYVPDYHNYICNNVFTHNSLVFEDRLIFEAINCEDEFPVTKESTLATANQKQLDPILDRIILRLTGSKLFKDFLKNGINKSKGTLDFPLQGGNQYRMNARIAGSKGENNMVLNLALQSQICPLI